MRYQGTQVIVPDKKYWILNHVSNINSREQASALDNGSLRPRKPRLLGLTFI